MWTKKKVKDFLTTNPHFENFLEEGKGEYTCRYIVEGIPLIICYTVSGQVECLLLEKPISEDVKEHLQIFSSLAIKICNEILNEKRSQK